MALFMSYTYVVNIVLYFSFKNLVYFEIQGYFSLYFRARANISN